MACTCFYRLIIFVLITGFTVCTLLSIVMPLWTRTLKNTDNSTSVYTIRFANIENTTTTAAGVTTKTRTSIRNVSCARAKNFDMGAFALVVLSVILGGINVFCALVWIMAPCGFPIGAIVFILTAVCFLCSLVPFVLIAYVASTALCSDALSKAIATNADKSFGVKHGYVLLLVAFAGLFVTFVLQVLGCACGCQLEKSKKADRHETTIENFDRSSNYTTRSRFGGSEMSTYSVKK